MVSRSIAGLALAAGLLACPLAARAASCEALTGFAAPDITITSAQEVARPVPHCLASGVIGREIKFSVWLPQTWNGKFVLGGNGGFAGSVQNQSLVVGSLEAGYASAGTDTGHVGAGPESQWALGDMERIVNYAHLAVHRVTVAAKAIVASHYGRPAASAYFLGCSGGGRQALMAAQRYPEDFDAIVAGAPALDFVNTAAHFTYVTQRMYPDGPDKPPVLSAGDRRALREAVDAACDAQDGLKDGILADPRACRFDPATLACPSANRDGCLSEPELAAVRAIYEGPRTPEGRFFVGYPFGGEDSAAGWGSWLVGAPNALGPGTPSLAHAFGVGYMRHFLYQDPQWSYAGYDFSTFAEDSRLMAATLSAINPDLSKFRARGGKLLMYHGWSDSALSALRSISYVDEVYAADAAARSDVRLFVMPGVLHCVGGPGPDRVDFLAALDAWVSGGPAPDSLVASFAQGGGGRTLCAHPKVAAYTGGDPRAPESFVCR